LSKFIVTVSCLVLVFWTLGTSIRVPQNAQMGPTTARSSQIKRVGPIKDVSLQHVAAGRSVEVEAVAGRVPGLFEPTGCHDHTELIGPPVEEIVCRVLRAVEEQTGANPLLGLQGPEDASFGDPFGSVEADDVPAVTEVTGLHVTGALTPELDISGDHPRVVGRDPADLRTIVDAVVGDVGLRVDQGPERAEVAAVVEDGRHDRIGHGDTVGVAVVAPVGVQIHAGHFSFGGNVGGVVILVAGAAHQGGERCAQDQCGADAHDCLLSKCMRLTTDAWL
jgi:hypothetical protein